MSRARGALASALLSGLLIAVAGGAHAAPAFDERTALEVSQGAIGTRLDDHAFRDTAGRPLRLSDFQGRPLVVNMVFTGCTRACPVVVQNLYPAVEAAQRALGEHAVAVATIGFDARNDTPERMRAFARSQGVDLPNWFFLSADQATIDRLADQLGFVAFPSAEGFDHLAQTTVVDGDGIVYRQIYGGGFEVPALVEPLKDLVFGRRTEWTSVEGLVNRVLLFCTLYDPRTDSYRFDWSVFIGMAIGALSLSAVGGYIVREWRRAGNDRTQT